MGFMQACWPEGMQLRSRGRLLLMQHVHLRNE